MATNPYAVYLGDRNPKEVIAATTTRITALFDTLGAAGAERALAPGKWTARQSLCHRADCETVFAFRLRQALAEDNYVIQPFAQDAWSRTYHAYDVPAALAVFSAVRGWNLRLLKSLPAESMNRKLSHPERGEMSFRTVVETMAGHDLNHLRQIEGIAAN